MIPAGRSAAYVDEATAERGVRLAVGPRTPRHAFGRYGAAVVDEGALRRKILVIDDDDRLRDVLSRYLVMAGFDAATAADGHEGLAVAKTYEPDLIILDLMMPGIDGLEVCKQLKADPDRESTLVVVFTALREEGAAAVEAGADGFIPKPFNLDKMAERVRAFLGLDGTDHQLDAAAPTA